MNHALIKRIPGSVALLAFLSLTKASPLLAGTVPVLVPPTFEVRIEEPDARTWRYAPATDLLQPDSGDDGTYKLMAPYEQSILQQRAHFRLDELEFNPDPFVLNNVLITNNTAGTQVFSVFVGLPTSFVAPNLISGHVRTTVIDGGSDGATIQSLSAQPIYESQIDSASVAALQSDPFLLVASPAEQASSFASFGATPSTVPVLSSIGIQLRFSLTPGDTAAVVSRFDVTPVPEPGAPLAWLALAVGLTFFRRRWCAAFLPIASTTLVANRKLQGLPDGTGWSGPHSPDSAKRRPTPSHMVLPGHPEMLSESSLKQV